MPKKIKGPLIDDLMLALVCQMRMKTPEDAKVELLRILKQNHVSKYYSGPEKVSCRKCKSNLLFTAFFVPFEDPVSTF
jgi:hypothetical protein